MATLIDRRSQSKGKSAVNRNRFMKRCTDQIKDAVDRVLKDRSIKDVEKSGDITLPKGGITEPSWEYEHNGQWEGVHPGNKQYQKGDQIERPQKGKGSGGAGNSDMTSEDNFAFTLSREEFLQYFFEGMELPELVKKQLEGSDAFKYSRAGYAKSGVHSNLSVIKSLKASLGRRVSAGAKAKRSLKELEDNLESLIEKNNRELDLLIEETRLKIRDTQASLDKIPFIDTIDLRYTNKVKIPDPCVRAVMFCVMDASGSMGAKEKTIAKKFFTLLYLFLTRAYDKVDIVFIRHTTEAKEVDENTFFYSRETGGTMVSSALDLMTDIIMERYATNWNIYVAQATDGDNWSDDCEFCFDALDQVILDKVQYYAYIEIAEGPQIMWELFSCLEQENFQMARIKDEKDIYPVFQELFKKQDSS